MFDSVFVSLQDPAQSAGTADGAASSQAADNDDTGEKFLSRKRSRLFYLDDA